MNDFPKDLFIGEISEICKKYGVIISSSADAADDTSLCSWVEVLKIVPRTGRWGGTKLETIFKCDEIGPHGT